MFPSGEKKWNRSSISIKLMNKTIICTASVCLALTVSVATHAQATIRSITADDILSVKGETVVTAQGMKKNAPNYDRIGDALYEIIYEYHIQTTLQSKDPSSNNGVGRIVIRNHENGTVYSKDLSGDNPAGRDTRVCDTYSTILQVGTKESRFLDYLAFRVDSLTFASAPEEELAKAANEADRSAFYFEPVIFQNWPEGNLTVDDIYVPGTFTYTEKRALEWTFGDGKKEVCGYMCQEARTSYGGRDWIVWYAPEIASTAGPWKLCGLPGLILEAQDVEEIHHFTATTIRSAVCAIVRVQDAGRERTQRDRFIKRKNESGGNSFDNVPMESITSIDVIKNDNGGVIKLNGRIPIRTNGHVWVPLELR